MYLIIFVGLLIALYMAFGIVRVLFLRKVLWNHIPGPPVDNLLKGHLLSLQKAQEENRWLQYMKELTQEYGTTLLLWRYKFPIIFTSDPEVLESVWNNLQFEKIATLPNRSFLGSTITGTESFLSIAGGLNWAMKRKILTKFFTKANQVNLFSDSKALIDNSIYNLKKKVAGTENFTWNMEIGFATLSEEMLILCGLDKLTDVFQREAEYLGDNVVHTIEVIPLPHKMNGMAKKKYRISPDGVKCTDFITKIRNIIQTAYQNFEKGPYSRFKNDPAYKDSLQLLGLLIEANQQLETSDTFIDNFVNDIMTLIIVADNIAKVLTVTLAKVLREPKILAKLKEEIESTDLNSFEDLSKLKYTEMVILESMRWCPILQRGARQLESFMRKEKIQLGKYTLPRTSTAINVQWSQYIMHHHEGFWDRPEVFDPERFRNGTKDIIRNTFIPFIAGPRSCLGRYFAMMQLKIVLHSMIRQFDMSHVAGEEKLEFDRKYTIVKTRQGGDVILKVK